MKKLNKKVVSNIYSVGSVLTLELNVRAKVTIITDSSGVVKVVMSGKPKQLKLIEVVAQSNRIVIKGLPSDRDSVINAVVRTGSGDTYVSAGNGGLAIGGNFTGGNITNTNGEIVVGGKITTIASGKRPPEITVTVPKGTNLEIVDTLSVKSTGLGGEVDVTLSNQEIVNIDDAVNPGVICFGQSRCRITQTHGNLSVDSHNQAAVTVTGETLGNIDARSHDQSRIVIRANCQNFRATARGQSEITLNGSASGVVTQSRSGQSEISIN
jgi:hypothetical protein